MITKKCLKCKKHKELNDFYFDKRRNKEISPCKECCQERQKIKYNYKHISNIINLINEVWVSVLNYEGKYCVSNYGRLKSLNYNHTNKECLLKMSIDKGGYFTVALSDSTKEVKLKTFKVHQLVAIAFLNHKPCGNRNVVNHKNFNKQDNRVENLEIVTNRENTNKKHIKSSSKYVGVSWDKNRNKWKSYINIGYKRIHLGVFEKEIDAHKAYQKALKEIEENENTKCV